MGVYSAQAAHIGIALNDYLLDLPTSSYRPAYSQVLDIPHHFPGVPVMALSATVTPKTLGLLQEALPASVLVKSSANRPNIFLEAHMK